MLKIVGALFIVMGLLTLKRGWFKFPPPITPMTRKDFPEGFYPLVAFFLTVGILISWAGWATGR
ncbi:MAG TPA: hypothetical protein VHZ78_13505 [Rhizomicrobium sp.]|jgi:hypothetical protein|nr:hypothetical protein [Rhizomicrobium sp.]